MLAYLIQIDGYDPVAASSVTLRAASHDDDSICHLDGQTWWPTIAELPSLPKANFDGDFGGSISAPSSSLRMVTEVWPLFGQYSLADARLRIWSGDVGASWAAWKLRFDGRITAQPRQSDGAASISFAVDDRWLDAPLLAAYTGVGEIEGPEALKGTVKPFMLGAPRYASGVLIDPVHTVFQLSSYGAIEDVEGALDGLARFGSSFGNYPDYAALITAAIPAGSWATCLQTGLTRHGAPPVGEISYMVRGDRSGPNGWARLPGDIMRRIAIQSGGQGKIEDASFDALNSARPWEISISITDQTTARDVLQRIAASVNAVAGVSWLGKLYVVPVGIGTAGLALHSDGSALPPVASVEQVEVGTPWWRLAFQAERTWAVHTQDAVQQLEPAEPGATVGAIVGVNIRIPEIPDIPAPPGLLRNDFLNIRSDGMLVYRPFGDEEEVELGRATAAGIGAAADSARRQLEDAVDLLGKAVAQALSDASKTRETFRDAGFYVDPVNGTVNISAIDQARDQVGQVFLRLNAVDATLLASASRTYVDNAIAVAALDPSQVPIFGQLEVRITQAELRLDGADASLALKASIIDLNTLGARVGNAELTIDALTGQIAAKVDSTEFDALGERVTSAEATLTAIGDGASISQAVTATRTLAQDLDAAHRGTLHALLDGDLARRGAIVAVSSARQELTAKINADMSAEAIARQALVVRVGAAEAAALVESRARSDGDTAVALMVTNLTANMNMQFAGFDQQIIALTNSAGLISAGLTQTVSAVRGLAEDAAATAESALRALLTGDENARDSRIAIAAAREEITAKINGDVDAVAQRVSALLVRMGLSEASILSEQLARASADFAIAGQILQIAARVGGAEAQISVEQQARADADLAIAASVTTLRAEKDSDVASLSAQVSAADQARIDGDVVLAASVNSLRAEKDDDIDAVVALVSSEEQARVDAVGAVATRVDVVEVQAGDDRAAIELTQQAVLDIDGKLIAYFRVAATDPDGTTYMDIVRAEGVGRIIFGGGDTEFDGNAVVQNTLTVDKLVVNSAVIPAFVYTTAPITGPGWPGSTDPGGGGGSGGGIGGGGGGSDIP